jgi:hypothetical protein
MGGLVAGLSGANQGRALHVAYCPEDWLLVEDSTEGI